MKNMFSDALLRAASRGDFCFWFWAMDEEINYAVRLFTDWNELCDFDNELTQDERTLFLLFVAEAFKEHGL